MVVSGVARPKFCERPKNRGDQNAWF